MRLAMIAAACLLAACTDSTDNDQVSANDALAAGTASNATANDVTDELIANPNGEGQVLRLEGNDSATFVGGELVEVNRAE